MTLSSRHKIRNSSPGGLRPSTLPLGHGGSPQYWLSHVDGEETFFVSSKPPRPGTEPRTLAWKAAVLTTTLGHPPGRCCKCCNICGLVSAARVVLLADWSVLQVLYSIWTGRCCKCCILSGLVGAASVVFYLDWSVLQVLYCLQSDRCCPCCTVCGLIGAACVVLYLDLSVLSVLYCIWTGRYKLCGIVYGLVDAGLSLDLSVFSMYVPYRD